MEFEENLNRLINQPMKLKEVLEELHESTPKPVARAVYFAANGRHLDEEMMNEALATITRYDGVKAPFWTMQEFCEVLSKTNLAISGQAYNKYDLNYLTQMYLADFKSLGQDPVTFVCMAVDRLHDVDDPQASEYAYHDASRRIAKKH